MKSTDKSLNRSFALSFRRLKEARKIKHTELRDELEIPYSSLWHWDQGKCVPRAWELVKLSKYLRVTVGQLLGVEE